MKNLSYLLGLVLFLLIVVSSCQKDTPELLEGSSLNLPEHKYNYEAQNLPGMFEFSNNEPSTNRITDAGATLGRVLFYDKALSLNNKISCGSCHEQKLAFSDGKAFSEGFDGQHTTRSSMALINLGHTNGGLFWDNRSLTLEKQALEPVRNHIEMGIERLSALKVKLQKIDYYPALFEDAFGSEEITEEKISQAMAQFMRSIVSYRSKYDIAIQNGFSNFTDKEMHGRSLFFSWSRGCASCHGDNDGLNLSGGGDASNIGLDREYADKGIYEITGQEFDDGRFKIPSLRNIALTAPYMHDGRFETLEEVIEHYNTGVVLHPNLDWRLSNFFQPDPDGGGFTRNMGLSEYDKEALVAFLHTLTDNELLVDEKFSDPFVD